MTEFHRFKLETLDDLRSDLDSLNASLPISSDLSVLGESVSVAGLELPNRFMVQPMEGVDGNPENGAPSDLTFRRYRRFAEGGSGLIWAESVAVVPDGRSGSRQMIMTRENLDAFKRLVSETREAARKVNGHDVRLVIQLTHSGRFSRPGGIPTPVKAHHNPWLDKPLGQSDLNPISDDDLDALGDNFVATARLAAEAGFDGIDIKAVHGYLIPELLAAHTREGRYGGSYENRTRFLRETVGKAMDVVPASTFVTTRLTTLEPCPYPYGWGVKAVESESWEIDRTEPRRLMAELYDLGMPLVNVSIGYPRMKPYLNRPHDNSLIGLEDPPEYPLVGVVRYQEMVKDMQSVSPEHPVPTAGLAWLRHLMPEVAAGMVKEGWCSLIGIGRNAFAYPDLPKELLKQGRIEKSKCCTTCSMCSQIMKDGVARTGCVIRDKSVYGPELKKGRIGK